MVAPASLPEKLDMKTISTALYAAVAAKSSARLAFVMRLIETEKNRGKMISRPTLSNVMLRPPSQETRYIMNTGTASRMIMTKDMTRVVSFSMREIE
jgi:hypothetical protein